MRGSSSILLVPLLILCAGCAGGTSSGLAQGHATPVSPMKLGSPDFAQGSFIPARFTCKGGDVSPVLQWTRPPGNTQAFALIVEDPDAPGGTWTHWLLYNLPAAARALPQGVPKTAEISGGGRQGVNDFGLIGYGGPCPPPGKPHRYFFRLYALNAPLALDAGASKEQVHAALQGRVVAETELMGRFKR
ncbi:MAG TPA: YbhB/YbcL family Raf kinase inhibitor-like protein [Terriglobia bacterium]|nr:YbhB/YbcL family Raf kinase inhibitor-like protein [Terriglobia bacterium]